MAKVGTGVEIDSERLDQLLLRLNGRLATAGIIAGLIPVQRHLQMRASEMFSKERDPYGIKWADLAPSTVAIRESMHFPGAHPINVRTGLLREYMTPLEPDIVGHSDGVVSMVYPSRKTMSDSIAKRMMQAQGFGKGPARKVIGLSEQDIAFTLASLNASLFLKLGGSK